MLDFLRPEARATLWRWREIVAALPLAALGLWWGLGRFGLLAWLGWGMVGLSVLMALTGVQRGRFRQNGAGPGYVQLDERRLAYFGPLTGGVMDLDDLCRVALEPQARPAPHWILSGIGGQELAIPVNAAGAEALFDVFAALPGIRTGQMFAALQTTPAARVTIWEQAAPRLN